MDSIRSEERSDDLLVSLRVGSSYQFIVQRFRALHIDVAFRHLHLSETVPGE